MVFTISAVTTLAHANNAMPQKVVESDGVVCRRKPPKDAERAIPMFWQSVPMPNHVLESLDGIFCTIIALTRRGTLAAEMPICLEHRKTEEVQSHMQSRIGQTHCEWVHEDERLP